MEYTYNLSGALIEQKYPSGRVVKNILDANGDLSIVQSKKNSNYGIFNYAEHFTYTAAGAISSMQLGNNRWESTTFNSRLQPTQIALGSTQNATNLLDLDFTYGTTANNGNVLSQTITVPTVGTNNGFTAVQTYTYDSLNRIKDATENLTPTGGSSTQTWKQTFSYDRYGNRSFDEGMSGGNYLTTTLTRGCSTSGYNPNGICDKKKVNPVFALTNRISQNQDGTNDYTFDNGGNTTKDANSNTYIYDAENKQIEVKNSSNQTIGQYWYDGDGKRVKKLVPSTGETTIFIYDASGKMVAEYSTIVETTNPQVSYLTNDHLGSPRIITDENGAVTSRRDFMPFGEEIASSQRIAGLGYAADTIRQKFTSYERDSETDLDFAQARMYANKLGRFTSIDPIIMAKERLKMPQRLNLYIYTINNPLKFTDPTGEDVAVNGSDSDITLYENDLNKRLEKSKLKVKVVKGKLTIVGKVPKNLKGDALKIVQAIQNKDKTANISLVRNDGQVDFGSAYSLDNDGNLSTSNQRIDYAELELLNSAKIEGYDSSVVAMHETLEAIGIQIDGKSKDDAHKEASDLGYPGLVPASGQSQVTGVDKENGSILGFQNKVRIEGTQTTFTYETRFSKPFTPAPGQRGPQGELETQKFRATSPLNITKVQK